MKSRLILYSILLVWHGSQLPMEEQKTLHEWYQFAHRKYNKLNSLADKNYNDLYKYATKMHAAIIEVKKYIGTYNIKTVDTALLPLYMCKQRAFCLLYHLKPTKECEIAALAETQSIAIIQIRSRSKNYLDDPHYAHIVARITKLYSKIKNENGYCECKKELEALRKRGNIPMKNKYHAPIEKEMLRELCKLYQGINKAKYSEYKTELQKLSRSHKYTHNSQGAAQQKPPELLFSSSPPKKLLIIEDYKGRDEYLKRRKHAVKQKAPVTTEYQHNSFCIDTLTGQTFSF